MLLGASRPNIAISHELLAFVKALLFSGNESVQDGIKFVQETREEMLFINIKATLDYAVARFKEG